MTKIKGGFSKGGRIKGMTSPYSACNCSTAKSPDMKVLPKGTGNLTAALASVCTYTLSVYCAHKTDDSAIILNLLLSF